eukprot:2832803-Amphidinium_carterae.1
MPKKPAAAAPPEKERERERAWSSKCFGLLRLPLGGKHCPPPRAAVRHNSNQSGTHRERWLTHCSGKRLTSDVRATTKSMGGEAFDRLLPLLRACRALLSIGVTTMTGECYIAHLLQWRSRKCFPGNFLINFRAARPARSQESCRVTRCGNRWGKDR